MNIFGKTFSSVKLSPRRSVSLNNLKKGYNDQENDISKEFEVIKLSLGDKETRFQDGEWLMDSEPSNNKEVTNLRRELKESREENNILKLKVEILLDMLTERSAENLLKASKG